MTPKETALLDRLREIIDQYIDDPELRRKLKAGVGPTTVKGTLAEMDGHTMGRLSTDLEDAIKEIYSQFC